MFFPASAGFLFLDSAMDRDFRGLADTLLSDAQNKLQTWLPNGRLIGHEYCVGDISGNHGDSLKVNINTGKWADFSTNQAGGDLLSLYAAIRGIKNGEAYIELGPDMANHKPKKAPKTQPQTPLTAPLTAPPDGTPAPHMFHSIHGVPSASWCYRNPEGQPMFYVARYDKDDKKQIVTWSWDGTSWIAKGWPAPRPLYGLEQL